MLEYLATRTPSNDMTRAVGYFNALLLGGESNRIDPNSAAIPAREGSVMWIHSGAQWNDPTLESAGLDFVHGLWQVLEEKLQLKSSSALYGCPDLELGSQTGEKPNLDYVKAYWSSPAHDFTPFLVGVKNKYDPCDLFRFAQSIPLGLA